MKIDKERLLLIALGAIVIVAMIKLFLTGNAETVLTILGVFTFERAFKQLDEDKQKRSDGDE